MVSLNSISLRFLLLVFYSTTLLTRSRSDEVSYVILYDAVVANRTKKGCVYTSSTETTNGQIC